MKQLDVGISLDIPVPRTRPPSLRAIVTDGGTDAGIALRYVRNPNGVWECRGVETPDGGPMTVAVLVRAARSFEAHEEVVQAFLRLRGGRTSREVGRVATRSGRARLADDFLANVAAEYRANVERGSRSPTADIARAHGVARSAVNYWLRKAGVNGSWPKETGISSPDKDPR